jgi:hypothetical protein
VKSNGASLVKASTFAEVAKAVVSLVHEDSEVGGTLFMDGGEAHFRNSRKEFRLENPAHRTR